MQSKRNLILITVFVILAMALGACVPENQGQNTNVSSLAKEGASPVVMDSLELGQTVFTGKVMAVEPDAVVIDHVVFRVDQNSMMPVGLAVGDLVDVEGVSLPDNTQYAAQVQLRSTADHMMDDGPGLKFKLYGIVEAMNLPTWLVSGEVVNVMENAFIESGIQVGDLVEVEGYLINDEMFAYEISKEDHQSTPESASVNQQFEFYGEIESITADLWVIGGRNVQINNQTELKGQ